MIGEVARVESRGVFAFDDERRGDASVASFAVLAVSSPACEDEPLPASDDRLDPAREAGRAAGLTESRIACTQSVEHEALRAE